jgi:WhiB family redox-sensing transcriptional regulator
MSALKSPEPISGLVGADDWRVRGACRDGDPNIFFPEPGKSPRPAKAVCKGCAVIDACLAWALEERVEHGVWGGKTWSERRRQISDAYQAKNSPGPTPKSRTTAERSAPVSTQARHPRVVQPAAPDRSDASRLAPALPQ